MLSTRWAPSTSLSASPCTVNPPQLLGPFCSWEAEGLHCSCSSQASLAPALSWWIGGELLEGNSSQGFFEVTPSSARSWVNSSLSLQVGAWLQPQALLRGPERPWDPELSFPAGQSGCRVGRPGLSRSCNQGCRKGLENPD
ncbi:hypothetical protein H8959_005694 [Pygathrix nigripes]